MCRFGMYAGSPDSRSPAGGDKTLPRPPEGVDGLTRVSPPPGPSEMPRSQGLEGAFEPPMSVDMGDPITISDESGGDPRLSGGCTMDEKVEDPQTEGRTPWPIGLHSI